MTQQLEAPTPSTGGGRPGRSKKKLFFIVVVVLAVILIAYGVYWLLRGRFIETTDDAYVGGNITVVSPHVAGYIERLAVDDNQHVHAGQVIVELQSSDYQATLDATKASEREARATLVRLAAQREWQAQVIDAAGADMDEKKAALNFAQIDATRYEKLAVTQADTRQSEERSKAALQQVKAQLSGSNARLRGSRQQLAVLDAQIVEAEAALARTGALAHTADLNLGYTKIVAPMDGYVGNRAVHIGSYVTPGAQIVALVSGQGLWVDANFKEDQLGALKPGQPAKICADVLPSQCLRGHVQSVSPATGALFSIIPPQNATGNFTRIVQRVPVRIAIDGDYSTLGVLRPGLSTTVTVNTRGADR